MQKSIHSLEAILLSVSKYKKPYAKKRILFDQAPLGGIGVKWIISFFLFLPFLLYAGIFNPWMFSMLGIAQSIVFFVVFLSMLMIVIFGLAFINNTKVMREISPIWEMYFPDVGLAMVLSSGTTPYKDFFKHYSKALNEGMKGKTLHAYLKQAFIQMKEENKDLLEAIQNDRLKSRVNL